MTSYFNNVDSCQGVDDFNHRLFLVSNECGQENTLQFAQYLPLRGNTLVGCSGFFSLDLAAVRGKGLQEELQYVVVLDRSLRMERFWQAMRGIISESTSKEQVFERVITHVLENCTTYFADPWNGHTSRENATYVLRALERNIQRGTSWLSNDESFERIQKIFAERRFVFARSIYLIQILYNKSAVSLREPLQRCR